MDYGYEHEQRRKNAGNLMENGISQKKYVEHVEA